MNEEDASSEIEMVPIVEEEMGIGEFGDRKTTNIVENGQKEAPMASLPLQPKQLAWLCDEKNWTGVFCFAHRLRFRK